jgi:hypothetical protein
MLLSMSNQAPPVAPARPGDADVTGRGAALLAAARRGHAGLFWFAAAMAVTAGAAVVGLAVDDRLLLGAPLWLKPLKFAVSFGLYALTLAWMLSLVRRGRRVAFLAGWLLVTMSTIEIVIIVAQAARGRRSHFNADTPLDERLFSIMGMAVTVLWLVTAVLAVVVIRQRIDDRVVAWSIGLGLVVALLGMAVGLLMTGQPGGGAHSVGVADGGPGLPLVGWSTTGGDLRVAHFVGIHALQVIPLFGAVLVRRPARERDGVLLVLVAAAGYLGLVALLTWQALRGQPLLAPDAATLSAAAALVVGVVGSAVLVVAGGRRRPQAWPASAEG